MSSTITSRVIVDSARVTKLTLSAGNATGNATGAHNVEAEYVFAGAVTSHRDPNRFWAGNEESWDYSQGNPINPTRQGQDLTLRPNNGSVVVYIAQGVNIIGIANKVWRNTFGKVNDRLWGYPVAVEDGFRL